ncbi:unnamed protein product [Paramecium sonneborni]|uniref:WD40 repeat-containing protein n=1 Tax=Paramecium sonneborni TaxID=65129 RepID=A0A8S1RQ52_9CILI|nr:unnamed protein product [Paramecium sonneborni]
MGICIDNNCQYQRPYCHYCLPNHCQHLNKLILSEMLNEWIQKRILSINDVQMNAQECKSILDSLLNKFIPYFNIKLEQLGISQINQIIKGLCQIELYEQQFFNKLKSSIEQVKQIVNKILKDFISQTDLKQNIIMQVKQPIIIKPIIQELTKQVNISKPKQFTFELIKQNSIKQDDYCCAIAFNKDGSILLAASYRYIKIYQNKEGKLNQIQCLREHTNTVYTLNFMKITNNFVSGSYDNQIIIWYVNGNNEWKCQQKLNGHLDRILCLLIHNTDSLIISGSGDKTIKFWIKQNQWLCQLTITEHTDYICSLSLSEEQNKVISCSADSQILVIGQ